MKITTVMDVRLRESEVCVGGVVGGEKRARYIHKDVKNYKRTMNEILMQQKK